MNTLQAQNEAALIVGVLDLRMELDTVSHISSLDPEAFLVPSHRTIWAAFQALTSGGRVIDPWAMGKAMRKLGAKDADNQLLDRYFNESSEGLGSADLKPRVEQVAESFKRRVVAKAMTTLSEAADGLSWHEMEAQLAEVAAKVSQAGNPRFQAGTDYARQFEAFLAGSPILPREHRDNLITFGVEGIDDEIMANPGRLMVIGGLPSAGKTALALQGVIRTAQAGKRVALTSLEMDADEISARIVANVCGMNSLKALRYGGTADPEDRWNLDRVRKNIVGLHGCAGDTWQSIEAAIVREHRRAPLSVAIVDYLQLMGLTETKGRNNDTEAQQIAQITMGAKRMAQKLGINVVILSQFNRQVKECEEPSLQNFLGSGQIERDIDIALLLWNTQVSYQKGQNRRIKCRIAKNRGGERYGLVELDFNPALNRFAYIPKPQGQTVGWNPEPRRMEAACLGEM